MTSTLRNVVTFEDRLRYNNGYWKYLDPEFEKHLENYLPVFEKYRSQNGNIPSSEKEWNDLPFGDFAKDSSWKWRRQSLSMLQHLIKNEKFETTLEIGPWSGWLTQYLAKQSRSVIGTDYFTHPFDGIGNLEKRDANIIAVQCNVEKIATEFKNQSFDLIVLNHCLAYSEDPAHFIIGLIPLLKPGGRIISLGNSFFRKPENKENENEKFAQQFLDQYHLNLYIQPVKGFLDTTDVALLERSGFKLHYYPKKILHNIYARLNHHKPIYFALSYRVS